jgi:hypothetical protein
MRSSLTLGVALLQEYSQSKACPSLDLLPISLPLVIACCKVQGMTFPLSMPTCELRTVCE